MAQLPRHPRSTYLSGGLSAWAIYGVGSLWWPLGGPRWILALVHALLAALAVVFTLHQALPIHHRLSRRDDDQDIAELERWHVLRAVL